MASMAAQSPAGWNVLVTLTGEGFKEAVSLLRRWGAVKRTAYYNVIAMTVDNPDIFLGQFSAALDASPGILNFVSHVVPIQQGFDFATPEEFEARSRAIALGWTPRLGGKGFHVRLHRRGFKGVLSTPREERFLDDALLAALQGSGHIDFTDPDAVIQIETIDGRAGMSLWTREQLRQYAFLGAS